MTIEPSGTCALCGKPIEVGEAWLVADEEEPPAVAHSGCVYAVAMNPDERRRWTPSPSERTT